MGTCVVPCFIMRQAGRRPLVQDMANLKDAMADQLVVVCTISACEVYASWTVVHMLGCVRVCVCACASVCLGRHRELERQSNIKFTTPAFCGVSRN